MSRALATVPLLRSAAAARSQIKTVRRVVLAASLLAGAAATAQPQAAPDPPRSPAPQAVARWTTEQGLPSNIVLGAGQTPDGFLWLASYQGLVRFDGVSFRTYTESDIPGLARASFWGVDIDEAGALWAASENAGLVRHDSSGWRVFTRRDGLKSDRVTAILPVAGDTVWIGTRSGVCRLVEGARITCLPAPNGDSEPSVTALALGPDGALWIGTVARGLLRYAGGTFSRRTMRDGMHDDRVTTLFADRSGTVWVGGYAAGVTRIRHDSLTVLASRGRGAPQRVDQLLQRGDGTLWLAADNGLFRLDGDQAVPVTQRDGRPIAQAEALFEDQERNLWVGSRQGGLFRLRETSVRAITTADGLPHDLVSAVDGDGEGGEWLATQGGVAHRTPAGITRFTVASGALRSDFARDILRDSRGDVWVATNGGLTRLAQDGVATTFTVRDGLADTRARTLAEGRDGTIWIGTLNGLTAYRDGVFRSYGRADGLTDGYVLSVFEDRSGTLWVGTQAAGLFRRTPTGFVPALPPLVDQPVFRMTQGADGTLWVGSARGLVRLRGDSATLFATEQGLPGNTVFQALSDDGGNLWLTGPWGVGRVALADLEAVGSGARRAVTVKQFGRDDGMPAHEASSISRAWRGDDGALRFATPAGLAILDPSRVHRNELPPPTHITGVSVDGIAAVPGPLELAPDTRKLEFQFTAPSFVAPTQIRFRYRLDGFDPGWVDGGTDRRAAYTSLPAGRYTFRVQARNEDGVWSDTTAAVAVRMRPYFWNTGWFIVLVAALVAAAGLAAHRLRVRAVARRVREQTLRAISLRDELTGVYNRRGLLELADHQMRVAERERRGFTLVFVDMDGMKQINDTLGHQQGDLAIVDSAALLRATFRASDILGRLGGDEFAVIVPDPDMPPFEDGTDDVQAACTRLADAVEQHNNSAGRSFRLSFSVGVSRFDPARPRSMEALLDEADREMYAQKRVKTG